MAEGETSGSDRVIEIFEQAARLRGDERRLYLDEVCAGDDVLRSEIESLLQARDRQGEFLAEPTRAQPTTVWAIDDARAAPLQEGDRVGHYVIRQRIGEGGFAVVYRAEQTDPVRREVALKIIKLGMDTKQVIARFEAERQALALMDHPNVAKVLDAGATEAGRPYFVMEYVPGDPITDYCDRHRLRNRDRLDLFIQACEAVQHAHQKGIIHRDIKPSNVLVAAREGKPIVKVIDFGVAKAINQKLTEQTIWTGQGQLIGTPAYMSPEQAEMRSLDVDTRSDIYSLGVLLYELLTGELPFDPRELREAGYAEIQRIIREQTPPKPSTKLSSLGDATTTIAERHQSDPKTLLRDLRGDLDWIVMKCLEKDRVRRYETANGLASDLGRHVRNEPVEAGPPRASYRIGKFVRRHRATVASLTVIMTLLITGIVGASWGLIAVSKARDAESAERQRAQQVTLFLREMLQGIEPRAARGLDTTLLRSVLDDAAGRVESELSDAPLVQADLCATIGVVYNVIGDADTAESFVVRALEIRQQLRGDLHPDTLTSVYDMAGVVWAQGDLDRAEAYLNQALEGRQQELGPDHYDTIATMAVFGKLLTARHDFTAAEHVLRECLARASRICDDDDTLVLLVLGQLGHCLARQQKFEEAEAFLTDALSRSRSADADPLLLNIIDQRAQLLLARWDDPQEILRLFREFLDDSRRVYRDDHPITAHARINLAAALTRARQWEEAEELLRRALADLKRTQPADALSILSVLNQLGVLLQEAERFQEAEDVLREAVDVAQRSGLDDHREGLAVSANLGNTLHELEEWTEAEAILREVLETQLRVLTEYDHHTLRTMNYLGALLQTLARYEEAERHLQRALEGRRRVFGADHPETLESLNNLADLMRIRGRYSEAEPLFREAVEGARTRRGEDDRGTLMMIRNLGSVLKDLRRYDEAEELLLDALHGRQRVLREGDPDIVQSLDDLGHLCYRRDQLDKAEQYHREAFELCQRFRPEHSDSPAIAATLGRLLTLRGKLDEAEPLLRQALARQRQIWDRPHNQTLLTMNFLALLLEEQGRLDEAEPLCVEVVMGCREVWGPTHDNTLKVTEYLIRLYEQQGKPDLAAEWREGLPTETEQ